MWGRRLRCRRRLLGFVRIWGLALEVREVWIGEFGLGGCEYTLEDCAGGEEACY